VIFLFIKDISPPKIILSLEALLRKIPVNHPKRPFVEEALAIRNSGYKGELSLKFYLSAPQFDPYFIFHNLRLEIGSQTFQIDFLIINNNYALILEVKNYSGKLFFDKQFNQIIRTLNDKTECFLDPITQVERQHELLEKWFNHYKVSEIPVEHLVIISNPSTIITASPGYDKAYKVVCKSDQINNKLRRYEEKHSKKVLQPKEITRVKKLLLAHNLPLNQDLLEKYSLNQTDLVSGVICPRCLKPSYGFFRRKWLCENCGEIGVESVQQALNDYCLLIGTEITNKELREFLRIPSQRAATAILSKLKLPSTGTTSNRVYKIPPPL